MSIPSPVPIRAGQPVPDSGRVTSSSGAGVAVDTFAVAVGELVEQIQSVSLGHDGLRQYPL